MRNSTGPVKTCSGGTDYHTSSGHAHMPVTATHVQQNTAQPDQYATLTDFDSQVIGDEIGSNRTKQKIENSLTL